jgi:hypothetical protein
LLLKKKIELKGLNNQNIIIDEDTNKIRINLLYGNKYNVTFDYVVCMTYDVELDNLYFSSFIHYENSQEANEISDNFSKNRFLK